MGDILKVWDEENSIWIPIPAIQGAPGPKGDKGDTGDISPLDAYPVGAIYISTVDTSPAELFGGNWTRIKSCFLLATDTDTGVTGTYPAGNTGGAATVTLTTANLAAHTHGSKTLTGYAWIRRYGTGTGTGIAISGSGIVSTGTATWSGSHSNINASGTSLSNPTVDQVNVTATHEHTSVGSGTAHENMPPYLAVYIWQRVA